MNTSITAYQHDLYIKGKRKNGTIKYTLCNNKCGTTVVNKISRTNNEEEQKEGKTKQ